MNLPLFNHIQILVVALMVVLSPAAKAETLLFRSDFWCPYVCNPNSSRPGYMVEVVRGIFEKQGYKIDIQLSNWIRSIKETRQNKAQALLGCSRGDASDFIFPAKSLGVIRNAYFTGKKSTWSYTGRNSLQNKRIGVINGYFYGDTIDALIRSRHKSFIPFSGERPLEQILKMIETGRLDGFIENPVALAHALIELKIPGDAVKMAGWVETHDPKLYAAFSPENPKSELYAEMLSKGLEELRRTGELQKILAKYGLEDWEKEPQPSLGSRDDLNPSLFKGTLDLVNVFDTGSLKNKINPRLTQ